MAKNRQEAESLVARRKQWGASPFNPYIVLADVTIATIVVFILLLLSSDEKSESRAQELQVQLYKLDELGAQVKKLEDREMKLEMLRGKVAQKNKELDKLLDANNEKWTERRIYVSHSGGPTSYLVRVYGTGIFKENSNQDRRTNSQYPKTERDGRVSLNEENARLVIETIAKKCAAFHEAEENPSLIEIRIEGHCDNKWSSEYYSSLDRSLDWAKKFRSLFDKSELSYISVSGFGGDRPAYETTAATLLKELTKPEGPSKLEVREDDFNHIIETLRNYDKKPEALTMEQIEWMKSLLEGTTKEPIKDRIDIILVYSSLETDNHFVFPQYEGEKLPQWYNDVSSRRLERRFLEKKQDGGTGN